MPPWAYLRSRQRAVVTSIQRVLLEGEGPLGAGVVRSRYAISCYRHSHGIKFSDHQESHYRLYSHNNACVTKAASMLLRQITTQYIHSKTTMSVKCMSHDDNVCLRSYEMYMIIAVLRFSEELLSKRLCSILHVIKSMHMYFGETVGWHELIQYRNAVMIIANPSIRLIRNEWMWYLKHFKEKLHFINYVWISVLWLLMPCMYQGIRSYKLDSCTCPGAFIAPGFSTKLVTMTYL